MLMCYPEYVVPTMFGLCLSGNRWAKVWNFNNCPLHQVIECHIHDRTWRWNTSPGTRLDLLWTFLAYPRCVCQTIPGMATEPLLCLHLGHLLVVVLQPAIWFIAVCCSGVLRSAIQHVFSRLPKGNFYSVSDFPGHGHPLHWIHHRW